MSATTGVYVSTSHVAIITGAGSGIGRATALELAASGWRCTLVGRRANKLEETCAAVRHRSPLAETLALAIDIAEPAAADQIVRTTVARWGARIDALINNAAVLRSEAIHQVSDEAMQESFEINAMAPARLVRSVWPAMAGAGGRIVNVSSMSSLDPFPGLGVYGMTKSALEGLTRAIDREGASAGILAFSIVPGAVETDMLRSIASEKMLPRGEAKDPAEIARVVVACARGERDHQAGQAIVIT